MYAITTCNNLSKHLQTVVYFGYHSSINQPNLMSDDFLYDSLNVFSHLLKINEIPT